jgi:hypothetical protein
MIRSSDGFVTSLGSRGEVDTIPPLNTLSTIYVPWLLPTNVNAECTIDEIMDVPDLTVK